MLVVAFVCSPARSSLTHPLHARHTLSHTHADATRRDKNDPSTWTSPKEFKMAKLAEMDKNSKFDCPPLQSQDEVAEDLKYKRNNKVIYLMH